MDDRRTLTLSPDELAGDLPPVCVRTGNTAHALSPVWFARSPWWSGVPISLLIGWAVTSRSWAPLVSYWAAGAILLPLLVTRGVTGRLPLDDGTRRRIAALRTRRFGILITALLLTWVAVGLWLLGSRVGGVMVLVLVLGMYASALGMAVAGRLLLVRGHPRADGGVVLQGVHPAFADAVELRRTGHRP